MRGWLQSNQRISVIIKPQLINVIILEILDRTLMIIIHRRRGVEIQTRISIPVSTVYHYPRRSSPAFHPPRPQFTRIE